MTEEVEGKIRELVDELALLIPRQGAHGTLELIDGRPEEGLRFVGNQAGYLVYGMTFLDGGLRGAGRDRQGNLHAATDLPPISSEDSLRIHEFLRDDTVSSEGVHYHWSGAWASRIWGVGCLLFVMLAALGFLTLIEKLLRAWAG